MKALRSRCLLLSACLIVGMSWSSCASLHSKVVSLIRGGVAEHVTLEVPVEAPANYKAAVALLAQDKFAEALEMFDRFLQQNPATPWTQAALLNTGRSLEGLVRWQEAADRYHQVIAATTARAPKLQAMALYRLSFCHEALGDDPQVVADLSDLLSRSASLPSEVAQGEMPARLASAYARVGNFERAQEFYRRAEFGIAKLRQASSLKAPSWLAQTLFLMGESSRRQLSWGDFEVSVRPLARNQIYLLQAAELGQSPWSEKAAKELVAIYSDLVTTIEGAPLPEGEAVVAKRSVQREQWSRAGLLIDTLLELRARMVPETGLISPVVELQKGLAAIDKKLARLLIERPSGEGLTASAISRKKSGVKLQTLAPDDHSLEQQFLNSSREVRPVHSALVPAPPLTPAFAPPPILAVPPEKPMSEDPNL